MQGHPHGAKSPHKHGGSPFDFSNFTILALSENHYAMQCPTPMMRWPINGFFYLTSGEIFIQVENDSVLLKEGEMILIPANVPISIRYYNQTVGFMGGFSSDYITDLSQSVIERFEFLRYHNTTRFTFESEQKDRVNILFDSLLNIFKTSNGESKLIHTYLLCLLQELADNTGEQLVKTPSNQLSHRFLELLLNDNYKKYKPADFAQELSVTVNHLNKSVRQASSKSVSQWIDERLIVNAKILMHNPKMSIAEIANELSIEDQSYFARKFKQYEGVSPSEYRLRMKD